MSIAGPFCSSFIKAFCPHAQNGTLANIPALIGGEFMFPQTWEYNLETR
jgi:hypothetical protein